MNRLTTTPAQDRETAVAAEALSRPVAEDRWSLDRRRFLLAAAAGVGVTAMDSAFGAGVFEGIAGAAAPLRPGTGVLVLVTMEGGCDPLDTVVPFADSAYQRARGQLAVGADQVHRLDARRGLHPALRHVKSRWDAGDLAVIDGVGMARLDLSHFSAMAEAMHGKPPVGLPTTGWLGRYLDGLGGDPLHGVSIGSRVPLVITGDTTSGTALPDTKFMVRRRREHAASMWTALERMGAGTTGLGSLADQLADTGAGMMGVSDAIRPLYGDGDKGDSLASHLRLAAGLVNADLGVRVITVRHGGYDTHTDQVARHRTRMSQLDAGLAAFHDTLDPRLAPQTLVLCVSEFGRRVAVNGAGGTDHGAAYTALALGAGVRGGFYGELPSLTDLTREGNLRNTVDQRDVYATVLSRWLGADANEVLGSRRADLGFLTRP